MFRTTRSYILLMALVAVLAWAPPKFIRMIATAYSIDGIQKAGTVAREGHGGRGSDDLATRLSSACP